MKIEARSILAFMVIGMCLLMSIAASIYPFLNPNAELDKYANYFAKTSNLYSGIVGVIIGYYFARNDNGKSELIDGNTSVDGNNSIGPSPLPPNASPDKY
jgi:hypothetical protein